jgi:hypothetical protein
MAPRHEATEAAIASKSATSQPQKTRFDGDDLYDVITVVLDMVGYVGAMLTLVINGTKKEMGDGNVPRWLNIASFASHLPYIAPNIIGAVGSDAGEWYTIVNDGVTTVSIAKAALDAMPDEPDSIWPTKLSPWVECAINTVWLVPACAAIASSHSKKSDRFSFVGNAFFDLGGCISPAMYWENWKSDPETAEVGAEVFFRLGLLGTGLYGLFISWSGFAYLESD